MNPGLVSWLCLLLMAVLAARLLPAVRRPVIWCTAICFLLSWGWSSLFSVVLLWVAVWWLGLRIHRLDGPSRRWLRAGALLLVLLPLVLMHLGDRWSRLECLELLRAWTPAWLGWAYPLVPWIGVSYIVFRGYHYVEGIYQKRIEPLAFAQLGDYFLLWPILTAGPIQRVQDHLKARDDLGTGRTQLYAGMRRIVLGLVMSRFVVPFVVQPVDEALRLCLAGESLVASGAFGVVHSWMLYARLFFDFAGYSHIAIGAALLLGYRVVENFNRPYRAYNVADFWRRWHMSLSAWARHYVFFPTAGPRATFGRVLLAALATMVVIGVWHGFAAHFLVWGVLHGVALCSYTYYQRRWARLGAAKWLRQQRWAAGLSWAATQQFVAFCWLAFDAESWSQIVSRLAALM